MTTSTPYHYPTTPAGVIALGRPVMGLHPELALYVAELLHTLDRMDQDARVLARRYLLHVYGITVGITTPASTPLAQTEEWAEDRQTVAAAAGVLRALSTDLHDEDRARVKEWAAHWADQLAAVARRG